MPSYSTTYNLVSELCSSFDGLKFVLDLVGSVVEEGSCLNDVHIYEETLRNWQETLRKERVKSDMVLLLL